MKNLNSKLVKSKKQYPLTKVGVRYEGQWVFATLAVPTRKTRTQDLYLISYPFGLVKQAERNPAKTSWNGKAGSYIAKSSDGTLAIITPEDYARLFPRKDINPPSKPITSSNLTDPNYITNTVRKSRAEDSNTIQVGTTNTFTSVDPNRSIIITPAGVQEGLLTSGDPDEQDDTPLPANITFNNQSVITRSPY